MATLKQVILKGFKSIKDMDLELRPLNVLIGANGAGKSNFVSFFKMLHEMMAGRLQTYIRYRWPCPVSVALWGEDDTTSGGDTTV